MIKITFVNEQAPALNANNLNLLQTNIENAINEAIITAENNAVATSTSLINNATLTIQKNGSTVANFGANASSNVTANISVPIINYGTSLPSSADNGTIFLLY